MSFVSTSPPPPGKRPGKQNRPRFGLRGSTVASKRALLMERDRPRRGLSQAENRDFGDLIMPKAAECPLLYAFCCFPLLPRLSRQGRGSKKRPRRTVLKHLISLRKSGAGEGIRTLDPNLGKVVLYP